MAAPPPYYGSAPPPPYGSPQPPPYGSPQPPPYGSQPLPYGSPPQGQGQGTISQNPSQYSKMGGKPENPSIAPTTFSSQNQVAPWDNEPFAFHMCSCSQFFPMSPGFTNEDNRIRFFGKVILIKGLQLILYALAVIVGVYAARGSLKYPSNFFVGISSNFWAVYILPVLYIILFIFIRFFHLGRKPPLNIVFLVILTTLMCVFAFMAAIVVSVKDQCNFSPMRFILPHALFSLSFSLVSFFLINTFLGSLVSFFKADPLTQRIKQFIFFIVLILLWSLIGIGLFYALDNKEYEFTVNVTEEPLEPGDEPCLSITDDDAKKSIKHIIIFGFIISFFGGGVMGSILIFELQEIIAGKRLPLSEEQYIFTSIYL